MAVAVFVLLLLAYLIPALFRRRAVMNEASVDERFSQELHLIRIQPRFSLSADPHRGRIYRMRRNVSKTQFKSDETTERTFDVRAVSRARARARGRIAARNMLQRRFLVCGAVFLVLVAATWIVFAAGAAGLAVPAAGTVLAAAYGGFFHRMLGKWSLENKRDIENIARATDILESGRAVKFSEKKASSASHAAVQAEKTAERKSETVSAKNTDAGKNREAGGKLQAKTARTYLSAAASADRSAGTAAHTERKNETAPVVSEKKEKSIRPAAAYAPAFPRGANSASASSAMPAYTLKPEITRRTVKPYTAPETETAPVPYRPKRVGEQLGAEKHSAANPAPEMTGEEELRTDVLGSGSALDTLLARRRAC